MYLTAGGTADRVKKATQTLTNAVIGLVIVAFSYMLVTFVINTIVTGKEGNTGISNAGNIVFRATLGDGRHQTHGAGQARPYQ